MGPLTDVEGAGGSWEGANATIDRMSFPSGEERLEDVYGATFRLYDRQALEEFIEPFEIRFRMNVLDADGVFGKAECLDAGSGSGRGSIFMCRHGARAVTAIDFAPSNVETTRCNAESCGFGDRVQTYVGSVSDLPFEDESFDVVWCNGVLQHSDDPQSGLQEITRVLRPGGKAWIYVYGSGGLYWRMIQHLRRWFLSQPPDWLIALLRLYRYPTRYVAEYVDDWSVPNLRTYTRSDFLAALTALGYEAELLTRGLHYDTNERRSTDPQGAHWFGEGDLRVLATKVQKGVLGKDPLPSSAKGSAWMESADVVGAVDPLMNEIEAATPNVALRVAAGALLQRGLRDQLSEPSPFDLGRFVSEGSEVVELCRRTSALGSPPTNQS